MSEDKKDPSRLDAGMQSLDHYKSRLPKWHYAIRNALIPLIRAETPYLAKLQETCRTGALDTYFAIVALLGTHTFYMAFLPLLFWTGYTAIGRAMVHILASGVVVTGALKDMLCLPRPLSPPLARISKSHSAALEYGFPSTHSANAVSVAVYALYILHTSSENLPTYLIMLIQQIAYVYVMSIVFGRVYCGMHGFFDVVIGCLLGALISAAQCIYGKIFDQWLTSKSNWPIAIFLITIILLVRMHPEPADNCPCFDDSVAFCGVVIGVELGYWHLVRVGAFELDSSTENVNYDSKQGGMIKSTLRIFLGLAAIFAWRAIMKPTLLKILPPVFRIIENAGLLLPRRYFLNASQYKSVPKLRKDENLIPQASDIPAFLSYLRHPRKRTVSIGPQSEADAREVIAYREERRRRSRSGSDITTPILLRRATGSKVEPSYAASLQIPIIDNNNAEPDHETTAFPPISENKQHNVASANAEQVLFTPGAEITPDMLFPNQNGEFDITEDQQERQDQAMFSLIQKPRVRYDVEVVTKLIVYTGIGWIAAEGCLLLFEFCGLGMGLYSS